MSLSKLAILGGTPCIDAAHIAPRWPHWSEDARTRINRLLDDGVASYPRCEGAVAEFERAFAAFTGARHAMTTHSGTGALHAGYYALDLPVGGEVIVPAYTHIGTALPMLHAGLVPVLCDIDAGDGNLDIAAAESAITPNTVAIAVTHIFGQPADMTAMRRIADKHGLRILQDCSHAHGATDQGRHVGSDGDVACFSLQSHKAVAAGEGGVLITNDANVAERAALLGHYREPREFTSQSLRRFAETGWGLKSRLHPFAAVLALDGLAALPGLCEARGKNYARLQEQLRDVAGIDVLPTRPGTTRGGFFRFALHVRPDQLGGLSASRFVEALHAEGAQAVLPGNLAKPLHSYAVFQEDIVAHIPALAGLAAMGRTMPRYRPGDFPRAERFSELTIQLPAFGPGQEALVDQYAQAIAKVCAHAGDLRAAAPENRQASRSHGGGG